MAAIPQHEWLMRSLFAYDLVGLQSEADVAHFTRYVRNEGGAEAVDEKRVRAFGATVVVQSLPHRHRRGRVHAPHARPRRGGDLREHARRVFAQAPAAGH